MSQPPPIPSKTAMYGTQRNEPEMAPQLGATFVPGGFDDYYMPEVVAPSPQRVMPEVPQNMQEDLQRMELEAREPRNTTAAPKSSSQPGQHGREPSLSTAAPAQQGASSDFKPFKDSTTTYQNMPSQFEGPNFSPFPRVKGDNIPPSDEEKEEILFNAREHVLHSNNVSMQLSWARDALNWVEIAAEAHMRENNGQMTRSQTPKVEHQLRTDAIQIVEYLSQQNHP